MMQRIAFFGLGTMGVPIVKNLLKAGYAVSTIVHNCKRTGPDENAKYGAYIADTVEQAVKNADVIMSIVTDDAAVRDIYLNKEMHQFVKEGAIIIEMTSCSSAMVMELQDYYLDKSVRVIDAPVTGAKIGAETGTLTILGAGEAEAVAKVKPILDTISKKFYNLGTVGNGKFVKATTNLMGAVNLAVVGEIYRLVKARGIDMEQFFTVAQESAGGSTQFTRNFPKMVQQDYSSTFTLKLLRKDMGLALDMAEGVDMPISQYAYQLYQVAALFDNEDCSAIAKVDQLLN